MRHLSAFLVAEGPTDHSFLPTVLSRALIDLVRPNCIAIPPVQSLHVTVKENESKHHAVCRVAKQASGGMSLLFYHYDGSANQEREANKYWAPLTRLWPAHGPTGRELVRVVPVREMESWALADQETLKGMARHDWDDSDIFELGKMTDVESLTDPKRTLNDILSSGRRRCRANRRPDDFLPLIAENLSLAELRRLRSFKAWEDECREALRASRFI